MDIDKFTVVDNPKVFSEPFSPWDVATINDHMVKIEKIVGEHTWHSHDSDKIILVIKGKVTVQLRDKNIDLDELDGVTIPKNVEHCPFADKPAVVLIIQKSDAS